MYSEKSMQFAEPGSGRSSGCKIVGKSNIFLQLEK
jgi:hypothetical protein